MPYLGAHMFIAGGLELAVQRIQQVQGKALQIFSKNQRQWRTPALTSRQIDTFLRAKRAWGEYPVAVHNSYLINLAAGKEDIVKRSIAAMIDEIDRAAKLHIPMVIETPKGKDLKEDKVNLHKLSNLLVKEKPKKEK